MLASDLLGHLETSLAQVTILHALAGIENEHRGHRSIAGGSERWVGHLGSNTRTVPGPRPQPEQQHDQHTQSAAQQRTLSRQAVIGPIATTPTLDHHAVNDPRNHKHRQQTQHLCRPLRPVIGRWQLGPSHGQHQ